MRSKLFFSTLTLALAIGGAAVLTPIPGAMAQHYVDHSYWVEDFGHGCPEFSPYGCGLPYPPTEPCFFSPYTVIVVPVDCPPGFPCHSLYSDSSFGEIRAQSSDSRYRNDSFQGFEGTGDRTEAKEFQADRRERFEGRQPTTPRPEIELQSPVVQAAEGPDSGNALDRGSQRAAPDENLDLQGGWEFDDSSTKGRGPADGGSHNQAGDDHAGHDHSCPERE